MGGENNINRIFLVLPSYASCVCLSSFLPTLKFINMGNTELIGCNTSILEIRLLLSTTCSGTNPGSSLPVHSASPSASLKPHKTTYGNKSFRKVISRIMSNAAASWPEPQQGGTELHGGHEGSEWVQGCFHMEEITELENEAKQFVHLSHDHVFCICCAAIYLSVGTGYVMLKFILCNADQLDHRCWFKWAFRSWPSCPEWLQNQEQRVHQG